MGSAIGVRFEELRAILDGAKDVPLGVCLDTAHLFEAGYEIHTAEGLERTLADFDRVIGLERLFVVHCNDSKTPFGSRVDRHQNIGQGEIGREAFGRVLRHARLASRASEGLPGRAFILETPVDAPGDDRRNVQALWELSGVDAQLVPEFEEGYSMTRVARVAAEAKRPVKKVARGAKSRAKVKSGGKKRSGKKTKGRG
jgi:deoxyribonuclease IV